MLLQLRRVTIHRDVELTIRCLHHVSLSDFVAHSQDLLDAMLNVSAAQILLGE